MPVAIRIFLTGGTGFFGKALLRHWHAAQRIGARDFDVVVLSRDPEVFRRNYPALGDASWLHFVKGDIQEPESLPKLEGITHVLHAATDSTLGPTLSPLHRFDQILQGTRHILDFAVRSGARRFLLCSSGGVYGPPPSGVVYLEESHCGMPDPLEPKNAYSIGKRAAEHLCSLYAAQYDLEVVIARCFAFVGQDLPRDVHFAIGNFIRDALESPEITVAGDGTPLRSYLDQRDLAEWLEVMLMRGLTGTAYNVGSDLPISLGDLANLVRDQLAPNKVVRIKGGGGGSGRNIYVPRIDRAKSLGLGIRVPLVQAIRDAAATVKG
jgi:UDP-glucuronate decarboxylase